MFLGHFTILPIVAEFIVNVFFLGMYGHPSFMKNMQLHFEYINNLFTFAQVYDRKRYGIDLRLQFYYPNFKPTSYEHLQQWDQSKFIDNTFGSKAKQFQFYVVYDIDLDPHGVKTDGYADCEYEQAFVIGSNAPMVTTPANMTYGEMPAYSDKPNFFGLNPYKQWTNFSRMFFHELDHQFLYFIRNNKWLKGVHTTAFLPFEVWNIYGEFLGYTNSKVNYDRCTRDSRGNPIYFMVQQDARFANV